MHKLFWSPIRFFEARQVDGLHWLTAAGAPALCAVLQTVSGWVTSAKLRPAVDTAMATIDAPFADFPVQALALAGGLLGYPMFFGVMFLAVLAFDIVVSGSEQPRLLAKFTAVSFYTQVPWCLVMVAVAWHWTPEPLRLPVGASGTEVLEQLRRHQETVLSGPLMSTGRLLEHYSQLWLSAMLAVALKVVGSLSVRSTVAAGAVMFTICMAGPLMRLLLDWLR